MQLQRKLQKLCSYLGFSSTFKMAFWILLSPQLQSADLACFSLSALTLVQNAGWSQCSACVSRGARLGQAKGCPQAEWLPGLTVPAVSCSQPSHSHSATAIKTKSWVLPFLAAHPQCLSYTPQCLCPASLAMHMDLNFTPQLPAPSPDRHSLHHYCHIFLQPYSLHVNITLKKGKLFFQCFPSA